MTVSRQLRLGRWAVFAACLLAIGALAKLAPVPSAFVGAFVVAAGARPALRRVNQRIARRAFARLHALSVAERFTDAHALLAELRSV